jgi:hypothetical protein
MTTLEIWINASLKIMEDNVEILRECQTKGDIDLLIEQSISLKKHVDSFLDFLEKRRKFNGYRKTGEATHSR